PVVRAGERRERRRREDESAAGREDARDLPRGAGLVRHHVEDVATENARESMGSKRKGLDGAADEPVAASPARERESSDASIPAAGPWPASSSSRFRPVPQPASSAQERGRREKRSGAKALVMR